MALLIVAPGPDARAQGADLDGDGSSWPTDCNDGNGDAEPSHPEICDGFDNRCVGQVDPGCLRSCPATRPNVEVNVGGGAGPASHPRVAATTAGFDVVWVDERDGNPEIYLARFDPWGQPRFAEKRLTNDAAVSTDPSLASPGDWRAVAWVDERDGNPEIYFDRVKDASIFNDTGNVRITTSTADDLEPSIAWAGHEWAVAYAEGRHSFKIHAQRITDSGFPLEEARVSGNAGSARRPSLAYTGSGFGVVWEDDRHGETELYFRALDASLSPTTPELRVTSAPGASSHPSLTWAGDRFVLAWQDSRDGNEEVYIAMLDASGIRLGSDLRLTTGAAASGPPRAAFTGAEILVVWVDAPSGATQPLLARVGLDGSLLEGARPLGAPSPGLSQVDVTWNGTAPIAVWADAATSDVLAARARCCGDLDADGSDRCDGDCDDARADIRPGASELCDGRDEDCSGQPDDGCVRICTGPDLVTPETGHLSGSPTSVGEVGLEWNGVEAGLVWDQDYPDPAHKEIFFQLLSGEGTALADPIRIASDATQDDDEPGVASRPGGWAVLYQRRVVGSTASAVFQLLDAAGNPVGTPASWSVAQLELDDPKLVWDGRSFGLVYETHNLAIGDRRAIFWRLSAEGVPIGDPFYLGTYSSDPSVTWTGSLHVVAFEGSSSSGTEEGVYWTHFDVEGRQVRSPERIADAFGAAFDPEIVWTGDGYGLAYVANHQEIVFKRMDREGLPSGYWGSVAFVYGHFLDEPSLAFNGQEFLVQWTDEDDKMLRGRRLDAAGFPFDPIFDIGPVGTGNMCCFGRSGLAAVGNAYLSARAERSASPRRAASQFVGCCSAEDLDGDFSCLADCDPNDPAVHPYAPEICDGKDSDCDGAKPPSETTDADADGAVQCLDCDDADPLRYPGAQERCNGVDDDCDGYSGGEGPFEVVRNLRFLTQVNFTWDQVSSSPSFDTQRGTLIALRETGGDFAAATEACLVYNANTPGASDTATPPPGEAYLYYVASGSPQCPGTYDDEGAGLVESRDAEVQASAAACP